MKIVFLNLWYGERERELIDFINEYKSNTDIFCFQESSDRFQLVLNTFLFEYNNFVSHKYVSSDGDYYQSTFIRKEMKILGNNNMFEGEKNLGLETGVTVDDGLKIWNIGNFHGFAKPGSKRDSSDRMKQSMDLIERFNDLKGEKIIGGDFNLQPRTKSIKMFETAGYINLISEYKIKTTRNRFSWELYPERKQYFSDYVFVSKGTKVRSFEVIKNEISDHLPMVLVTE